MALTGFGIDTFAFGGLNLAGLDLQAAVSWIVDHARRELPVVVVTPNINHLHLRVSSAAARTAIDAADIQLADGWPLILASRFLSGGLPERIAGIDLVERLIDQPADLRIAILGGPADTAARLADRAGRANRVVLVDSLTPGWDARERASGLTVRLAGARPNLVLIGIGAPRQEQLAQEIKGVAGGPIVCCGAAIEVLAGFRPRAPRRIQRLGLEWAFRLAIEPRRLLRRYLVAGLTFLRVLAGEMHRGGRFRLRRD